MVTVSLSMLTPHNLSLLRDSLKSVGVALPNNGQQLNVKFVSRERSQSRTRSASRRVVEKGILPVCEEFRRFFCEIKSFSYLEQWRFKPCPKQKLLTILKKILHAPIYDAPDVVDHLGSGLWTYFQDKLGLRNLVEFAVLDFLQTCLAVRTECMEADVFVRFFQEFYDLDDFIFFQYVGGNFVQGDPMLSELDCEHLVRRIFGREQRVVGEAVLSTLGSEFGQLVGEPLIESMYFLYIALWVFHHQRQSGGAAVKQRHGFDIRDSISKPKSPSNQVDQYVDSIISLKAQTRELQKSQKSLIESVGRCSTQSSKDMERVIGHVLEEACRSVGNSSTSTADQLMQALMNEDAAEFSKLAAHPAHFPACCNARDVLMNAVTEGKESAIESALWQFCVSLATAAKPHPATYRN